MNVRLALCLSTAALVPGVLFWISYRRRKFRFFRDRTIPGPTPSLLNGNYDLMHSVCGREPWEVLSDWVNTHGKIFGYYRSGPTPTLVVADHQLLERILVKDHARFVDRTAVSSKPSKELVGSLTSLKGQNWKRVRSIIAPAFSSGMLREMSSHVLHSADTLITILEAEAFAESPVDLYRFFERLTVDIIARCAFGVVVDCQRDPTEPFLLNVQSLFRGQESSAFRLMMMFPEVMALLRPLMKFSGPRKKMAFLSQKLKALVARRRSGEIALVPDIIQLMLNASNDGAAGYETTSNALAFLAYVLSKHQDVQEKVFEEIKREIGRNPMPSYESLAELKYLDMVISETLRLYPPVISSVTRVASEDVMLGDFRVPAQKLGVEIPIWHLHHDPLVWDKPHKFDPERFSDGRKSSIPNMAYLPFGAGPRSCIGRRFALMEIKFTIVKVLQRFKLEWTDQSEDKIKLRCTFATLNPANGVFVRLKHRPELSV